MGTSYEVSLARAPCAISAAVCSRVLILAIIALGACKKRESGEQAYVERELMKLGAAVAENRETDMVLGCVSVRSGRPRMPPDMVAKIDQLCDLDVPRRLFENAIAGAKVDIARAPREMKELGCMQLMVGDAYKAFVRRSPPDPALAKLAAEYAQLCPEAAAKAEAKARREP